MASMTIHNLDEGVLAALEAQAARKGVSAEEEARRVLRSGVSFQVTTSDAKTDSGEIVDRQADADGDDANPHFPPSQSRDGDAEVAAIMALMQRLPEPFDLKRFSDALSDGRE
jgi:plasmid stability protein